MNFSVYLHTKATKSLEKINKIDKENIKKSISELITDLEKGVRLTKSPFWKLRIGNYRAIYEIDKRENKIIILFIGHRKKVYDDFSRFL